MGQSTRNAVVWDAAGNITDLGVGQARSMNEEGTVVGYDASGAWTWGSATGRTTLPGLGGGATYAEWINARGEIVGSATDTAGRSRAIMWRPSSLIDSDGDGVVESIDTGLGTFEDAIAGQPSTTGAVVTVPAGLSVLVTDAPDPDGVRVKVEGAGTEKVTLTMCGFTVKLAAGSDAVFTCGSLLVRVIAGAVEVTLADGSTITSATGSSVRIDTTGGVLALTVLQAPAPSIIDRSPPSTPTVPAGITAEAGGPNGSTVNFTSNATDLVDGPLVAACTPASGTIFPVGTTTVSCVATDTSGNSSASAAFSVIVQDTTAPTVALSAASTEVTTVGSGLLTATVGDAVGVSSVQLFEGSTLLSTDASAPFEQALHYTSADNGSHSYSAVARDATGNQTTSTTVTITVNIPAPPATDLSLQFDKAGSNFKANKDERISIVVRNNGLSATSGPLTITDTLPTGLRYVSASGSGWVCDAALQVVVCTRTTPLAKDTKTTLHLRVTVLAPAGTLLVNSASLLPLDATVDNADTQQLLVR